LWVDINVSVKLVIYIFRVEDGVSMFLRNVEMRPEHYTGKNLGINV
jgi:hypothetical protein